MNHNDTVSIIAQVDLTAHRLVKLVNASGTAKVNYAGAADSAIGTVLQDCLAGQAAAVFVNKGGGFHYVTMGDATAVVPGDELQQAANGKVIKRAAGEAIGIYVEGAGGADSIPRAFLYPAAASSGVGSLTVPGAAVADVAAANASDLATAQTLANELKTKFNALLASLRAAGVIAP